MRWDVFNCFTLFELNDSVQMFAALFFSQYAYLQSAICIGGINIDVFSLNEILLGAKIVKRKFSAICILHVAICIL